MIPTFDERPTGEVERMLERMLADGRLAATRATADDLARARVPAHAGPVFLRIARAHRTLRLVDAEVEIDLHDGEEATDAVGGWRLRADPDFLDIRLAPPANWNPSGDLVLDASWTPRGDELCVHSTFAHFVARAVAGDG
jgi:hypothetical protein